MTLRAEEIAPEQDKPVPVEVIKPKSTEDVLRATLAGVKLQRDEEIVLRKSLEQKLCQATTDLAAASEELVAMKLECSNRDAQIADLSMQLSSKDVVIAEETEKENFLLIDSSKAQISTAEDAIAKHVSSKIELERSIELSKADAVRYQDLIDDLQSELSARSAGLLSVF